MAKQLTNADILTILQVLQDETGKELLNKKIPVKLSYAIKYNLNLITKAYETYEETLKSLANQYGADLTKSGIKAKTQEDQKLINEELTNLLNEKVDIEIHTVPIEVIEKCGEGTYDALSFSEIERIDWLIGEEKEEKTE